MPPRFLQLGAAVLLAALSTGSHGAAAQEPPLLEVDVIFPRNETYKPSDTFPIALAIQNMTAVRSLGNFSFAWDVMPYSEGRIPSGLYYDDGQFALPGPGDDNDTFIFVANSNVSAWIDRKHDLGDRFALQWHLVWLDLEERCGHRHVFGHILFGVEAPWESKPGVGDGPDVANGVAPDVMDVPECPMLGSVVEIRPNATEPSCPSVVDEDTGREGTPCAVKVDKAVKSSIASQAASLATPPPTPTPTPTPTKNAARGVSPPVQTALAAACVLGCLTYVYS